MALRAKPRGKRTKQALAIPDNRLGTYLALHLDALQRKGQRPETVKKRDYDVRRFLTWCGERGLTTPQELTKPMLERYQRHLLYYRKANGEPLSLSTQCQMLTGVKQFFKWLARENHLLYNPASELELPKSMRRLPKHVPSIAEMAKVLAQPDTGTAEGLRDRALLEVLYATGMRRMELIRLRLHEVDVERGVVFIREGKGGRDRYVPLGERAGHWLQRYVREVRPELILPPDEGVLFLTDYGEPWLGNRLGLRVKRYLAAVGLERFGACHLFRHAMATHMLENGADIRFIQAILGHAELSTTQLYTQVSIKQLQAVHALTHPAKLHGKAREAQAVGTEEAEAALWQLLAAEGEDEGDEGLEA